MNELLNTEPDSLALEASIEEKLSSVAEGMGVDPSAALTLSTCQEILLQIGAFFEFDEKAANQALQSQIRSRKITTSELRELLIYLGASPKESAKKLRNSGSLLKQASQSNIDFQDFRLRIQFFKEQIRELLKSVSPFEVFIKLVDWCRISLTPEKEEAFRQTLSVGDFTVRRMRRSVTTCFKPLAREALEVRTETMKISYGNFKRCLELWFHESQPSLLRMRPQVELNPTSYLLILISAIKDYQKLLDYYENSPHRSALEEEIEKHWEIVSMCGNSLENADNGLTMEELGLGLDKLDGALGALTRELENLNPFFGFSEQEIAQAVQIYRKQQFHIRAAIDQKAEQGHYTKLKFLLNHFQIKLVSKLSKQDDLKREKQLAGGDPAEVEKAIFYFREHLAFLWESMYKNMLKRQDNSLEQYDLKTIHKFLEILEKLRSHELEMDAPEYSVAKELELLTKIIQGENIRKKTEKKRGDVRIIDGHLDEYRYALLELWVGLKSITMDTQLFTRKSTVKKNVSKGRKRTILDVSKGQLPYKRAFTLDYSKNMEEKPSMMLISPEQLSAYIAEKLAGFDMTNKVNPAEIRKVLASAVNAFKEMPEESATAEKYQRFTNALNQLIRNDPGYLGQLPGMYKQILSALKKDLENLTLTEALVEGKNKLNDKIDELLKDESQDGVQKMIKELIDHLIKQFTKLKQSPAPPAGVDDKIQELINLKELNFNDPQDIMNILENLVTDLLKLREQKLGINQNGLIEKLTQLLEMLRNPSINENHDNDGQEDIEVIEEKVTEIKEDSVFVDKDITGEIDPLENKSFDANNSKSIYDEKDHELLQDFKSSMSLLLSQLKSEAESCFPNLSPEELMGKTKAYQDLLDQLSTDTVPNFEQLSETCSILSQDPLFLHAENFKDLSELLETFNSQKKEGQGLKELMPPLNDNIEEMLRSRLDKLNEQQSGPETIAGLIEDFIATADVASKDLIGESLAPLFTKILQKASSDMQELNELGVDTSEILNRYAEEIKMFTENPPELPGLQPYFDSLQRMLNDYHLAKRTKQTHGKDTAKEEETINNMKKMLNKLPKLQEELMEEDNKDYDDLNAYQDHIFKLIAELDAHKKELQARGLPTNEVEAMQEKLKNYLDLISEHIDQGKDDPIFKAKILEAMADIYDRLRLSKERLGLRTHGMAEIAEKMREQAAILKTSDKDEDLSIKPLPFTNESLCKLINFLIKGLGMLRKENSSKGIEETYTAKTITMFRGMLASIKEGIQKGHTTNPLNKSNRYYKKLITRIMVDIQAMEIKLDNLNVKDFDNAVIACSRMIEKLSEKYLPYDIQKAQSIEDYLEVLKCINDEFLKLRVLLPGNRKEGADAEKRSTRNSECLERMKVTYNLLQSKATLQDEEVNDYRAMYSSDLINEFETLKTECEALGVPIEHIEKRITSWQRTQKRKGAVEDGYFEVMRALAEIIRYYQDLRKKSSQLKKDTFVIHTHLARNRKMMDSIRKNFHKHHRKIRGNQKDVEVLDSNIINDLEVLIREKKRLRENTRDLEHYLSLYRKDQMNIKATKEADSKKKELKDIYNFVSANKKEVSKFANVEDFLAKHASDINDSFVEDLNILQAELKDNIKKGPSMGILKFMHNLDGILEHLNAGSAQDQAKSHLNDIYRFYAVSGALTLEEFLMFCKDFEISRKSALVSNDLVGFFEKLTINSGLEAHDFPNCINALAQAFFDEGFDKIHRTRYEGLPANQKLQKFLKFLGCEDGSYKANLGKNAREFQQNFADRPLPELHTARSKNNDTHRERPSMINIQPPMSYREHRTPDLKKVKDYRKFPLKKTNTYNANVPSSHLKISSPGPVRRSDDFLSRAEKLIESKTGGMVLKKFK